MPASIPPVVICDQATTASERVAKEIADLIRSRHEANKPTVLGLATGSTPIGVYRELVRLYREEGLSFSKVITFNLDEYWGLEGSHEQSYRRFMNQHLFEQVDIPLWNTHVLQGKNVNPSLECQAFETKILAVGGVDLWLLGIGNNGHIAFNEPGSSVDSRTRLVNLTPSTIVANSDGRFFKDPQDVPRCALSAGIGTVREARRLIVLALGEGKASAVQNALEGNFSPDNPASMLQDHPHCTFVLDKGSSSALNKN